jgi:PAS domain S-box-containing protein
MRSDFLGSVVVHSNDTIRYATDSFCTLLGIDSTTEIAGTPLTEFVPTEFHDSLAGQFVKILDDEVPTLALKLEVVALDGTHHEVIAVSSPVDWEGTRQIQTSVIHIPDTESGVALPIKERAMQDAPVGITIADATTEDMPLVYVNDGFVDLTGYPREEILGRNCRFLQGDDTRPEPVRQMRASIEDEEPVTVELRNYRKDGSMFWSRVTISPIKDESGNVTHYLGCQEDISDKKLFEHEKSLFKKHAEMSDQVMVITDETGTIEYVNPAFERVTGYSAEEAIGENPRLLKSRKQDENFYENLWETITAGKVWESTITNQTKSGELYEVYQTIVPITNENDEITHFTAIERDVTQEQLTTQVLDVLNRLLRHNVRTSINVINGYAEFLDSQLEDPELKAAVEVISNRTDSLTKITERTSTIRDLLSGQEDPTPLELHRIENILARCQEADEDADITFKLNADPSAEIQNGNVFEVALEEVIENAVVHNDQETPTVTVTVTPMEDGDMVTVEIADNGPGIPQSEWEIIKVGQETPLLHTEGIGLWLLYWAMTALGGDVRLSDNEPRGSMLTLQVPLVSPSNAQSDRE